MRSIRRSLLGYLLVLLALAFGAVGLFVDRFANDALLAREKAESSRLDAAYELRRQEARMKFDSELLAETRALANAAHYKILNVLAQNQDRSRPGPGGGLRFTEPVPPLRASEDEAREYRLRSILSGFVAGPTVLQSALGFTTVEPKWEAKGGLRPFPGWVEFDGPRAVVRIQEAIQKLLDEDSTNRIQYTIGVSYPPSRTVRTQLIVATPQLGTKLSLDPVWLDPTRDIDPRLDDVEIAGLGMARRAVVSTWEGGRPLLFPILLPSPPPPTTPPPARYPVSYPPWRGGNLDVVLRVFVHKIRPHAELEARLAEDQVAREDQLARVKDETESAISQLRTRLGMIAGGSFLAVALGGWFIVARGLYPIRKLSDAVSHVSEKDFRLAVAPAELSDELAPIHARLTQTLDQLRRAFAREKEAVADISHELRTPIAALLATIDVALRKPRTPEQYRITLDECRVITRQLGQLVERIMTLASLDAGNVRTATTRADAAVIAESCAAVMRPLTMAHGLHFEQDVPGPLELDTDADKLHEILINLLHNAVEYNRPDGSVELTGQREGDRIVLCVRDTGIGMTPEVRERIFERFYRADPSRTATGVHAGLGLAIVKEYVERLNGTIRVESEPGVGTTFRVELPAASGESTARETPVLGPKSPKSPLSASS